MILGPLIAAWNNWRARRKRVAYFASCLPGYSEESLVAERKGLALALGDAVERRDVSDTLEALGKANALWLERARRWGV